jgi:DNA-binding transcriptional regulator YiaG/uncharacterized phage-associated protein
MNSPFTGQPMSVYQEVRTLRFRKEEFDIVFHAYRCEDTKELFESEELAMLNYNQLVNQYRSKYNIPFPEQIKEIREKYHVSAKGMSEIMGFGVNIYRQYEGGEVPSLSNAKLIQLASNPEEFLRLIKMSSSLDDKKKSKLSKIVEHLTAEAQENSFESELKKYLLGDYLPHAVSGFKTPNFEKFAEMVVFFSEHLQPWKTKLNKLLFYADFMMHRSVGYSISGSQYRAIPMGPVPDNFNSIFDYLSKQKIIDIQCTSFNNGGVGEQFMARPERPFNVKLFSNKELEMLETVAVRFKQVSTNEIIELSHKEKGWIENEASHKLIDYRYSFDLKII